MRLYELDVSWAQTASERRYLRWELLACEQVRGVFHTARDDTFAILHTGARAAFEEWARTLEPDSAGGSR